MKFDPGKAWPHPVLRPPNLGDDYPGAEFEVEIDLRTSPESAAVDLTVEFSLSSLRLLELVKEGTAQYALLVTAPQTHYRSIFQSKAIEIKKSISPGMLAGWVEFSPFLLCIRDLSGFHAPEWHSDFDGQAFDINCGSVLAEDESKRYYIDPAYENLIGSIFKMRSLPDLPDGRWKYDIDEDHIWISMSRGDEQVFNDARCECRTRAESFYLINGLYLPVLVASLNDIDRNRDDYQDYRWFASLDRRLEEVGANPLGSDRASRGEDGQKIFESPFFKMPIIARKREQ